MTKVLMGILMIPAGILNIILGATTEDLMLKVIMLIAGIVTVALSCLIASYLRHLENHGKMFQEVLAAIDKKWENQVIICQRKMNHIMRHIGCELDDNEE